MEKKTYGTIDPKLQQQTFVAKDEAELWAYCLRRFGEFWRANECPNRHPPQDYFDKDRGKRGWFFPAKWADDFASLPRATPRPSRPQLSAAGKAAHVERAISRLKFGEQISPVEAQRWQLPPGTQITPTEVIYPDGTRESIEDLRLRHGKYRPGAPQQSAEQQLLEDTLRTLHRQRQSAA